jgi:hypothetical protein
LDANIAEAAAAAQTDTNFLFLRIVFSSPRNMDILSTGHVHEVIADGGGAERGTHRFLPARSAGLAAFRHRVVTARTSSTG